MVKVVKQAGCMTLTVCHNYYAYNMYIRGTVLCVHLHVLHMYCTCTHVHMYRGERREKVRKH